ncbi:hypothetical protein [Methylobacterium oryzihabitans]|uniref:Peptidase U49 n=1 Tax=Methylobacterium oryzihabitans TaxID=2499852 RepID=A0A3S2VQP2_9HYPH|nr:hypothetical protein [Methylobacterium oryzihabitans]RVU18478.1 hypothetical protein EOE48_11375 [Methylobacterium oryzihabitans]
MDAEGKRPDYEDTAWLSAALRTYFSGQVLLNLVNPIDGVSVSGDTDLAFNASVTTADFTTFRIVLNDGCLAQIYEALDVPRGRALEPLIDVASSLFRGRGDYDLVCRTVLNVAVVFILLHEYAHVAAGHLDARRSAGGVAATETTYRWDEVPGPANRPDPALSLAGVGPEQVGRVFELEADATAYELLLDFAVDILLATDEARRALPSIAHADDLDPAQAGSLQQLIFYACALTVSLTEQSRQNAGVQGTYPSAGARMMSLCLALLRRQMPGEWRFECAEQVTRITEEAHGALVAFILPTMARAFDLCEACCANVRGETGGARASAAGDRRSFAHDFAVLLQGATGEAVTEAGRELVSLQAARVAILEPMRHHRRTDWWDFPDAS